MARISFRFVVGFLFLTTSLVAANDGLFDLVCGENGLASNSGEVFWPEVRQCCVKHERCGEVIKQGDQADLGDGMMLENMCSHYIYGCECDKEFIGCVGDIDAVDDMVETLSNINLDGTFWDQVKSMLTIDTGISKKDSVKLIRYAISSALNPSCFREENGAVVFFNHRNKNWNFEETSTPAKEALCAADCVTVNCLADKTIKLFLPQEGDSAVSSDVILELIKNVVEEYELIPDGTEAKLQELVDQAKYYAENLGEEMQTKMDMASGDAEETIRKLLKTIEENSDKWTADGKELMKSVKAELKRMYETIRSKRTEYVDSFAKNTDEYSGKVRHNVKIYSEKMKSGVGEATERFTQNADKYSNRLKTEVDKYAGYMQTNVDKYTENAGDNARRVADELTNQMDTTVDHLSGELDKTSVLLEQQVDKMSDVVKVNIAKLGDKAREQATRFSSEARAQVEKYMKENSDKVEKLISQSTDDFVSYANSWVESVLKSE